MTSRPTGDPNIKSAHPSSARSLQLNPGPPSTSSRRDDLTSASQTGNSLRPPPPQSPAQSFFRVPVSPRSNTGDIQHVGAKVAIPRLKRDADTFDGSSARGGARHRVNHACEPCRHRKTKCSGERPVCKHCQDFKITCFYADGKRDRVKKQFGTLSDKVAEYEKLLRSLIDQVPEDQAQRIRSSLERVAQSDFDDAVTDTMTMPSIEVASENGPSGGAESEASAEAGSTGALDHTDEDFTREGARQTGFMGKHSEVTWMQRLKQENQFGDDPLPGPKGESYRLRRASAGHRDPANATGDESIALPEGAEGFSIHESSYHLDDLAISTYDAVDPYELPPPETAQLLFSTYMHRVHPALPLVGRVNLTSQFRRFLGNPIQRPPEKWLAIINLIFAVSAKYSHLVQAEWKGDERDHTIYFTRARLLAIDNDTLFKHPDLQHIQILGLMSFYMMCISQVNRAWMLVGNALRAACAVGLNMRNDSVKLKESLKEIRYRLWWGLYSLESRLCSLTGRPSFIQDNHSTTPLPIPLDEETFESGEAVRLLAKDSQQRERAPSANSVSPVAADLTPPEKRSASAKSETSRSPSTPYVGQADLDWAKDVPPNSSLYFLHHVQLTRLSQGVFQLLYTPAAMETSWSGMQVRIKELDASLEGWYRTLPPIFDFRRKQRDHEFYEYRLSLGFSYYGVKQLIHRPCLCRLDRKVPGQSARAQDFNRASAMSCVEAAQDSLRLIPDEPNAVGLISVGPWWAMLHWLVQSATVLMLELSFRAHHMPEDADAILESSKKAVRWLHALGEENLSGSRAWKMCDELLRDAAKRIGHEVKDLPQHPPRRLSAGYGDAYMSELSTMNTVMEQGQMSQPQSATDPFTTSLSMSGHPAFDGFEYLMQYDQFPPGSGYTTSAYDNYQGPPTSQGLGGMNTGFQ